MKKIILSAASLLIAGTFLLSSCKKKEDITPDEDITTSNVDVSTSSTKDNNSVDSNIDDVMDDISVQLDASSSGRLDESANCGVKSVTVSGTQKTRKITYDGIYCLISNAKKFGTIIITLTHGSDFSEKGAQFTVDYQGYAVTSGNETFTLTGQHLVTNLTGGLPRYVVTRSAEFPSVELGVTGNMEITFDNSTTARTWQVARNIKYGNSNNILSLTISGSGSSDIYSNLVTWGTNRFGNKFYNQITTPIVSTSKCGFRRPIAGERVHTLVLEDGSTLTNTMTVTTNSEGCGNGLKLKIKNKKGKEKDVTITID